MFFLVICKSQESENYPIISEFLFILPRFHRELQFSHTQQLSGPLTISPKNS